MHSVNPIFKLGLFLTMLLGCVNAALAESKDVTMLVGETQTLYLPSSVTSKTLRSVNFYSNGVNYVQVVSHTNYSVKVKAVKAFTSPIIVRCDYYYLINNGGYTYQAKGYYDFNVTVVGDGGCTVKPTKITFPSTVKAIEVGETVTLNPTVYPSNAEYNLTWSINDKSVATVDQQGNLTGKSEGAADLKVTADNGVYAMLRVVVSKPSPSSVSVSPTKLDLTEGESKYLEASVYPSSASQSVTWTTSNSEVATVSKYGKVTAVGEGNCTIKATTSNNKSASATVKVIPKIVESTSISLVPESVEIEEGSTTQLSVSVLPENATTNITWTISNSSIATVHNGEITGISAGECTIFATTDNGLSATASVVVKAKEILPQSMNLSSTSLQMKPKDRIQLSAHVVPENATALFTWDTTHPEVAIVDNGEVTAVGEGECEISATTQNGLIASCHITVMTPSILPESIDVSSASIKLHIGESANLSATVYPSNSEYELTWTSSNETVATVSDGFIEAMDKGSCIITVSTQNGLSATCMVYVEKEEPEVKPSTDWSGTYLMRAIVNGTGFSTYQYPSEFQMTIDKGDDNWYYITTFIGLDCVKSYPYTGLRLIIKSETEAIIDLDYDDNAGGWTTDGEYVDGLHSLSSNSQYSYSGEGEIVITRTDNSQISISEFYVYYFGNLSDYEHKQDAHYTNCQGMPSDASGISQVIQEDNSNGMIEVYTLNGQRIYTGPKDEMSALDHGIYIIRKGRKTYKIAM